MFRISKLTDYATAVLTLLAQKPADVHSASELAQRAHLELPTVSKLLKTLAGAGLVQSFRGANGGYRLARSAEQISVAEIIAAMEGPIGVTECSVDAGICDHEPHCGVSGNWRRISDVVEQALRGIRLSDMCRSAETPSRHPHLIPSQLADG
ncbi:SUF system Fe-S cluster assembly regulator [Pseudomarimonas arenosa]|uniref:SUF system Fe-S cluster assembly regulator n=1 Tax=Pseudomarimonas arenosa TaxID=2774145 RepID=A0AAW3ZIZ0_9GAMM|nr:SUF system Fe-S cluster assembly regulator [Pseudomarimonas arenosa]MBD8525946.1 SUF system Fe-S cluster assembly regulator [Pseudomarimonas arenosa]